MRFGHPISILTLTFFISRGAARSASPTYLNPTGVRPNDQRDSARDFDSHSHSYGHNFRGGPSLTGFEQDFYDGMIDGEEAVNGTVDTEGRA